MVGVVGINPNAVVVNVFVSLTCRDKRFTTVGAVVHVGIHRKDFIDVFGVAENFLIVVATCGESTLFGPAFAFVVGAVHTTFFVAGFNNSIDNIGIGRRNSQAHAAHICFG